MEDSPDLLRRVDLTMFWRLMDNGTRTDLTSDTNSMFGPSLRQGAGSHGEAEMLSTHPLPEPTRVTTLHNISGSVTSTPATRPAGALPTFINDTMAGNTGLLEPLVDSPFLAQNFFALGQDFVGNADDWFNWTDMGTGLG